VLDGVGMGLGFCLALLCLGVVREVLGSGTLFGVSLFGPHYQGWVVMILPSGGFFTFAAWILFANWLRKRKVAS
jgi:electron transport complex protein RnfE